MAKRGLKPPFSPPGSSTVPSTAHSSFAVFYINHTAKTILFSTQHHHNKLRIFLREMPGWTKANISLCQSLYGIQYPTSWYFEYVFECVCSNFELWICIMEDISGQSSLSLSDFCNFRRNSRPFQSHLKEILHLFRTTSKNRIAKLIHFTPFL